MSIVIQIVPVLLSTHTSDGKVFYRRTIDKMAQSTIDGYLTRSTSCSSLTKRPAEDDVEPWRKVKRTALRRNETVTNKVTTSNRYGNLTVDNELDPKSTLFKEASRPKKKVGHVPPIILQLKSEWTHETITSLISKFNKNFHLQYRGNNKVSVNCHSIEAHQSVKDGLQKENFNFITYTRKDERRPKVVIRGLPSNVETQIADELAHLGFGGATVTKLVSKNSRNAECPPFLVQLSPGTDIMKFRQIKYLCNCVIQIQKFRSGQNMGTQCFRCQSFGHTSNNCNMPSRCVKCTEQHSSTECPIKDRSQPVRCCNCLEDHAASYRMCPTRQLYLERLRSKREEQEKVRKGYTVTTTPAQPKLKVADGHKWNEVVAGARTLPTNSHQTLPTNRHDMLTSSSPDESTKEMLDILMTIRSLKNEFLNCTNMMDKVILVVSRLGHYV